MHKRQRPSPDAALWDDGWQHPSPKAALWDDGWQHPSPEAVRWDESRRAARRPPANAFERLPSALGSLTPRWREAYSGGSEASGTVATRAGLGVNDCARQAGPATLSSESSGRLCGGNLTAKRTSAWRLRHGSKPAAV